MHNISNNCFTQDPSYGFEFSGVSGSGKRKFGLGFYNPVESVKKPDEFLTWQIPKQWSYEDASTVPFFYLQVSPLTGHITSFTYTQISTPKFET